MNEWTPCSVRQPEREGHYLVTIFGSDIIHLEEGEDLEAALKRLWKTVSYVTYGYWEAEEKQWDGDFGFPMNPQPVAWMPYPAPWDGGEMSGCASRKQFGIEELKEDKP